MRLESGGREQPTGESKGVAFGFGAEVAETVVAPRLLVEGEHVLERDRPSAVRDPGPRLEIPRVEYAPLPRPDVGRAAELPNAAVASVHGRQESAEVTVRLGRAQRNADAGHARELLDRGIELEPAALQQDDADTAPAERARDVDAGESRADDGDLRAQHGADGSEREGSERVGTG